MILELDPTTILDDVPQGTIDVFDRLYSYVALRMTKSYLLASSHSRAERVRKSSTVRHGRQEPYFPSSSRTDRALSAHLRLQRIS